jgi:uncharacterized protein YidB (DUF937 family)
MSGFGGLFSDLLRGMTQQGEGQESSLGSLLSQVLGNTQLGSLGGLLTQLQQGGLAGQVASWLGNGKNMPVSPDQLRSALGDEHVRDLAQQSGLSLDSLLAMLSKNLPGAIDRLSPNGQLQEPAADDGSDNDSDGSSGGSLADRAGLKDIR